jgi:serine/threonine-protein kinase GIN4
MVDGLSHLLEKGFVHRDIKLDNMLLDHNYELKLADFGTCGPSDKEYTDQVGTSQYSAPEEQSATPDYPYDGKKADVFSLGYSIFSMVVGIPPYN